LGSLKGEHLENLDIDGNIIIVAAGCDCATMELDFTFKVFILF
jgi:hypothetical protein